MSTVPDRRRAHGLGQSELPSSLALRGLLHDLGHDLATLVYLVEGMRGDSALSPGSRRRVELIEQETVRLLDVVRAGMWNGDEPEVVAVRSLLNQIVELAGTRVSTVVTLQPGGPVSLAVDGTLLWRMVTTLVEYAVRAAGPGGHVTVSATQAHGARRAVLVEVADDGPTPGDESSVRDSRGLEVVAGLAGVCGALLEIEAGHPAGSRVRLLFPKPTLVSE